MNGDKTIFSSNYVDGERTRKLVSVSTARLVCFLVVQGIRITVCSALCFGGSKFIGFTISLKDLILNCIALTVRRSHARGRFCEAPWCDGRAVTPTCAVSL